MRYLVTAVGPRGKISVAITTLLREGPRCTFRIYLASEKALAETLPLILIKITNLTKKYLVLKKGNNIPIFLTFFPLSELSEGFESLLSFSSIIFPSCSDKASLSTTGTGAANLKTLLMQMGS